MTNKDKTGNIRSAHLRDERTKWLAEHARGLSAEGLIGALMRNECRLVWKDVSKPKTIVVKAKKETR